MGDTAKALGIGPTLVHKGKTYRLSPLSFEGQALYEVWLEGRAWEVASRSNRFMTGTTPDDVRSIVIRDIASGIYSFGSPAFASSIKTMPGIKKMLHLCLLKEHPDVTEAVVDEIFEATMAEAVAKLGEVNADPNPAAPASPGSAAATADVAIAPGA